jgi:hypothetical protein
MLQTHRTKKITYIPGILSLLVLPILLIHFARQDLNARNLKTIKLYWGDLTVFNEHPEMFPEYRGHFPPKREYLSIELDENSIKNKIKFDFAAITVNELIASGDTLKGVHFLFSDQSTYGNFVKAIDICRLSKAKTYMPTENDLWIYNLPIIPYDSTNEIKPIYCGTTYSFRKPKPNDWTVLKKRISLIWNSSWQIILGFSVLAFISLKKLSIR